MREGQAWLRFQALKVASPKAFGQALALKKCPVINEGMHKFESQSFPKCPVLGDL